MSGEELDEWARENGEPESVGPQARLYRNAIGEEDEGDDDED